MAPDVTLTPEKRAVLFVHGVGEQKKSNTLLYMGSPLVSWVLAWSRADAAQAGLGPSEARVGEVCLSFVPFEGSTPNDPAFAVLHLKDQDWYLAEAWWAASSEHPNVATMLRWSLVHFADILIQMLRNTGERAVNFFKLPIRDDEKSSQPDFWWQLIDLVNCIGLAVLYAVAMVVGYPLILVLMVLAQIPIEPVQNFILLKMVQPLLVAGAGEFRMYLDDELQAANVRRRVAEAARELLARSECQDLVVVAHSEGAVVSLGMLTDPEFADVGAKTRKLLTFGAGLNKSWLLAPRLARLFGPLRGDIAWVDTWASYDPVPAGPLDPHRHRVVAGGSGDRGCTMDDVYQPNPPRPLESVQVTNNMNVMTDHGAYFSNDEQVVIRIAAEVSGLDRTKSMFWPDDRVMHRFVRKRRERISALALWRDVAVVLWLAAAIVPWLIGVLPGVDPWAPVATLGTAASAESRIVAGGALASLVDLLEYVHVTLPTRIGAAAPLAAFAGFVLGLPAFVGGALLMGVLVWALYALVVALVWDRWDAHARMQFVEAAVKSSRARQAHATTQRDVAAASHAD